LDGNDSAECFSSGNKRGRWKKKSPSIEGPWKFWLPDRLKTADRVVNSHLSANKLPDRS
jgi:hypothetical protein